MYSSKHCRAASSECLSRAELAHSETEARVLRDLAQSWLRVANQTERYVRLFTKPSGSVAFHGGLSQNPFKAGESVRPTG
jgi:hypothetical protein